MNSILTVTLQENKKSYHKESEGLVTRVEVYSQLFEEDTIYQDVTLDTAYSQYQKEQLNETFKNLY